MPQDSQASPVTAPRSELGEPRRDYPGTLALDRAEGYVGDTVTLTGEGLPANRQVDIVWHTVEGRWETVDADGVVGPRFDPVTRTLGSATTGADGTVAEAWTIPEVYGGEHTVEFQADGEPVAATPFTITPWFDLEESGAALGGTVRVTGYGLCPGLERSNYQITWDNGMVGLITGVTNHGTAHAEVQAVGPPGEHVLAVRRNPRGVPHLQADTQSPLGPVGGGRESAWTVDVTEPAEAPRPMWVDPLPAEEPLAIHLPDPEEETGAELAITPPCGPPETAAVITGEGFPPDTEVDLVWYRHEHDGQHVLGLTFTPTPKPDHLPTVTTDADGAFSVEVTIPWEEGATRPIAAEVDGRSVAVTGFMLQPAIVDMTPTRGPVGTKIKLEISGIGWTEYEKHVHVLYDNQPVGHICGTGFDFDRDDASLWTVLRAAGDPGYHFIDIYPTISEMADDRPEFAIAPFLSHRHNYPVRPLPAMHFAFEVTG